MPALRILFFGTPEIAVPTLESLIRGPHEVVGVISQPDRGRGRGRKESPSPVAAVALRENIALLRPERVGDLDCVEELSALRPDLGVVVAFGQFLPKKVRELPSCGYLINAHASLLPKYRGASPIAQAILEDDSETGVSVMRVEREMDAGAVAVVARTPIGERENTAELTARLATIASTAIAEAVASIAAGKIEWTDQDATRATVAPKFEKSDAVLDLRESARALAARVHALSPKPGGSITLLCGGAVGAVDVDGVGDDGGDADGRRASHADSAGRAVSAGEEITLKILRADRMPPDGRRALVPGMIERNTDNVALRIATGDGWLIPLVMQRAGGKALPITEFLRGFEIPTDARCQLPELHEGATP